MLFTFTLVTLLAPTAFADPCQTNPCYPGYRCVCDYDDGSGTGTPDGGGGTIEDLVYYLRIYAEGSKCADIDDGSNTGCPDGAVTIDDLFRVLFTWECGC